MTRLLAYCCMRAKDQNTWYLQERHNLDGGWSWWMGTDSDFTQQLNKLHSVWPVLAFLFVYIYKVSEMNHVHLFIIAIFFLCTDQIGAWSFHSVFAHKRVQPDFEAVIQNSRVDWRAAAELAEHNVERAVKEICRRLKKPEQTGRLHITCNSFTQVNRFRSKWADMYG